MTRIILIAFLAAGLAGPALAGQCPKIMKSIDAALAKDPQLSAEQSAEIKKLRAEGAKLHKSGKHADSVATLAKAKKILGMM